MIKTGLKFRRNRSGAHDCCFLDPEGRILSYFHIMPNGEIDTTKLFTRPLEGWTDFDEFFDWIRNDIATRRKWGGINT